MPRVFFFVVLFSFSLALPVFAQERSYSYDSIIYNIQINTDSTFDVSERQAFRFNGSYHAATRDIPLRGLGSISDIAVYDGSTGVPLSYSARRLNKLEPASWGKFVRYRSG